MIPLEVQQALDRLAARIAELEKLKTHLHREIATGETRVLSEVRREIDGIISGIQAHIDRSVQRGIDEGITKALAPYLAHLAQLDGIREDAAVARAGAEEASRYRIQREERERLEREAREKEDREALRKRQALELQKLANEVKDDPIDRSFKRSNAKLALVVTVLVALAGLIGAALGSHH